MFSTINAYEADGNTHLSIRTIAWVPFWSFSICRKWLANLVWLYVLDYKEGIEVEKSSSTKAVFVNRKKKVIQDLKSNFPWTTPVVEKGDFSGAVADVNEGGILVYLPEEMQIGDLFRSRSSSQRNEAEHDQAMAKVVWADAAAKKSCGDIDTDCN